jgi:hypothetical protein
MTLPLGGFLFCIEEDIYASIASSSKFKMEQKKYKDI